MMHGMVGYFPLDGHDKQSEPKSVGEDHGELYHDLPQYQQGHLQSHQVIEDYQSQPQYLAVLHQVDQQQVTWGQQTGQMYWILP